jgi:hypothetical protein
MQLPAHSVFSVHLVPCCSSAGAANFDGTKWTPRLHISLHFVCVGLLAYASLRVPFLYVCLVLCCMPCHWLPAQELLRQIDRRMCSTLLHHLSSWCASAVKVTR